MICMHIAGILVVLERRLHEILLRKEQEGVLVGQQWRLYAGALSRGRSLGSHLAHLYQVRALGPVEGQLRQV